MAVLGGTTIPTGSGLRRRIPGRSEGKNSAQEMVPTPPEIPQETCFFQKRRPYRGKKPCSLAGRENAQKSYSHYSFCDTRGFPAPAMSEIFTQIMGGPESRNERFGKIAGSGRRTALGDAYVKSGRGFELFLGDTRVDRRCLFVDEYPSRRSLTGIVPGIIS